MDANMANAPLTFKMVKSDTKLIKLTLEHNDFKQTE